MVDPLMYRTTIAAALKRELGESHRAIKTVMRWTGVSERTAKNWLSGAYAPAGAHLIELMRNSDEVVAAVLSLSGRSRLQIAAGLLETRETCLQIIAAVDSLLAASRSERGDNE